MKFTLPRNIETEAGRKRHVGFELEYSGVDLDASAAILEKVTGGTIADRNRFSIDIETGKPGTFIVEMDAALLKEEKYKDFLTDMNVDLAALDLDKTLDDLVENLASSVVPMEIVSPPLPMQDMDVVEELVVCLRNADARGTNDSVFYAFGLHINPEIASKEPAYLLNHMRAFVLLYDWICAESAIDLSRRITTYIKPWPGDYIEKILASDYDPDLDLLVKDYLDLVGSRNHALDMLPCFAHLREDEVREKAEEPELVKARPAFHYRLANCKVDEAGWTIAEEWRYWVAIENLAMDAPLLDRISAAYREQAAKTMFSTSKDWVDYISDQLS